MRDGLIDTNIVIRAHTTDAHSGQCRDFLRSLQEGTATARIEPLVLHELSYAPPHYLKGMRRSEVAAYLLMVLGWLGIRGDVDLMVGTVERWRDTPGLSFADAFLASVAATSGACIYSMNAAELRNLGVKVPDVLPG